MKVIIQKPDGKQVVLEGVFAVYCEAPRLEFQTRSTPHPFDTYVNGEAEQWRVGDPNVAWTGPIVAIG